MFAALSHSYVRVLAGLGAAAALAAPVSADTLQFRAYRDATIRGGSYGSVNFGDDHILEIRAADNDEYLRRAVLMFDTASVPEGASVGSAELVLTVKGGNSENRKLTACALPVSFDENSVTWKRRSSSKYWSNPGGDVAAECSQATITGTSGSTVTFDVTAAARKALSGAYGSRYVRFVVGDSGANSADSYKQIYSNNESTSARRPLLVVNTGTTLGSPSSASDVVINASSFTTHGKWGKQSDGSVRHPDGGAAKISTAKASPTNYLEATFQAPAGVGYRIWLHGRADGDDWDNDSVFVQFTGSVNASGSPIWRHDTTSAAEINLEDCSGCGLNGWKWQDNGWGSSTALGPVVYFGSTGSHTIRIQTREDGLRFDKIILSPATYLAKAPSNYSLSEPSSPPPADDTTVDPPPTSSPSTTSSTLRVLHWNTHHGGYGTDGKYDPNRIVNWIVKFNPDIISLNEIEYYTGFGNEDQPAKYASLLKQKTGRTWYYVFTTATGATKGNGNLILSRYPLDAKDHHYLSYDRSVSEATVYVNGRAINFFSTHLDDGSASYRTTEVNELLAWASGISEQRIIAGDFNTQSGKTEILKMTDKYYDAWAEGAKKGIATAYADNPNGNTRNSRIDYIFYSHGASRLSLSKVQVFDTRDSNGVRPSDHNPVMATFKVQ